MSARISIGTWAYLFNQEEPTTDFHTILHKLQDLGYDGVELGSFGPHPSPATHPTRASRAKLKKHIADHGLALSGVAIDLWAYKVPGVSILEEIPSAYLTAFLGWCQFAGELDAKTVRVDSVVGPTHFATDPDGQKLGAEKGMDRLAAVWDKCSKMAADYGLSVCWEFEPGFAFNKPSEVVRLVDAVRAKGNPNFGVLYDTCHAHMCAAVGANHQGEKEILPGGALELLETLTGENYSRPPDRQRRVAQRAQHQHAQPVRHRGAGLRPAGAGRPEGRGADRLVVRGPVLLAERLGRDRPEQEVPGRPAGQARRRGVREAEPWSRCHPPGRRATSPNCTSGWAGCRSNASG